MQAIGPVLSAVGTVMGGIAAKKAGQQNQAALYGQAIEEENAGNAQALRIKEQARRAIGEQVAAQWGNGFTGGSGSALDALTESQVNATMDMMQVRRDAEAKARSLRTEGDQRASAGKWALAESIVGAGAKLFGASADWAAAHSGELPVSPGGGGGGGGGDTWRYGGGADPSGRNPHALSYGGY